MSLRIDCDVCYASLNQHEDGVTHRTFFLAPYEEYKGTSAHSKLAVFVHVCNACLKGQSKLNLYLKNPYYVKPEEVVAEVPKAN
jgi:hypothetical protein